MADFLLLIEGLEIDFYNPRSVILFLCIAQGVIFCGLLFTRYFEQRKLADFWLALLLFFFCASLITPLIGFANIYDRNQWLTYFPFGIAYSYATCVYLYVLSLTDSKRGFSRKDLLLFLPSAVFVVFRLFLFARSLEFKDWFDENYYIPFAKPIIFITELLWNIFLLYFSIKHYRKYRAWLNENFSDTEKIKFDWLKNFLYIFTGIMILEAAFDFTSSFLFRLSYIQYFYFELILAFATYYLAIAGYLRSQPIEINFSPQTEEIFQETEKRRTLFTETELANIKNRLQNLMETKKPYLNPQISLNDLSKQLGINSSALSYVINQGFEKNFNDFVNEFRIIEVKRKLRSDSAANENLLNIAFDCGFNSKATFNRAFKKFTGISPKEFSAEKRQSSAD